MKLTSPLKKAHWPWPKMDVPEVARQASKQNIYMPNIGYLSIDIHDGWKADLGDAANSKRLWLNSLVSAHACLEYGINNPVDSEKYLTVGADLVKSYLEIYVSEQGIFQDAWRDEHAVANRLFVLTAFMHYASCPEVPHPEVDFSMINKIIPIASIFHHALIHAEWLNSDKNYVKNNHGVMMDISLAQFSVILRGIDKSLSERYSLTSRRRLNSMLELTFDKDGCCTENSPTYHFVNYSLFTVVLDFLLKYDLIKDVSNWMDRLNKARNVGNLFLRSDKTIPLIGDSENVLGTFFPQADVVDHRYGFGYYEDAGFFVVSQPDWHMTFKAGGASYSHRHIDDLSLTLQYRGKDFFVDCGMYNYDIKDKLRRWFISSRAHSGIYVESMGDVRFANFKSPQAMSRFVSLEGDERHFNICATHNLSTEVEIKRLVSYSDDSLMIEDSFACENSQSWRIQFNLHPDVKVTSLEHKGGFRLENDEVSLVIYFDPGFNVQIENINYSPKFMCLENSKSLVVKGLTPSLIARTKIEFDRPVRGFQ